MESVAYSAFMFMDLVMRMDDDFLNNTVNNINMWTQASILREGA